MTVLTKRCVGVISPAAGQGARLNVADTRALGEVEGRPPRARKVTLAFDLYAPATATEPTARDGAARTACINKLEFLRRESCEVTLRPGEAASLDFTAPEGTRVRAVAYGTPDAGGNRRIDDPNIRTTLEVQEGGRTSFVLSPVAVLFGEVDG